MNAEPISLAFDPSYNPYLGDVSFLSAFGATNVTMDIIQDQINIQTRDSIVFGVCLGSSIITFIVMWLVSKNRKTPIFILNQISLVLIIIHSSFYLKYLFSYPSSIVYYLTEFQQPFTAYDRHISAAADMFKMLLVTTIEFSLVFQVRIMFASDNFKRLGNILLASSIVIGLATSAVFLASVSMLIKESYTGIPTRGEKIYNISNILFASSINFMTFILMIKLVWAIRARRFLGLKQFDSFHILLIMTCHSMVIPSILTILAYALHSNADVLVSLSTLLVVLSLPLSAIWAASANTTSSQKNITQDFDPENDGFYPNGSESFMNESLTTNPTKKFHSKFTDKFLFNNQNNTNDFQTNGNKNGLGRNSVLSPLDTYMEKRTVYELKNKRLEQMIELDDESHVNLHAYTPDTQDDLEARKFWLDQEDDDDEDTKHSNDKEFENTSRA